MKKTERYTNIHTYTQAVVELVKSGIEFSQTQIGKALILSYEVEDTEQEVTATPNITDNGSSEASGEDKTTLEGDNEGSDEITESGPSLEEFDVVSGSKADVANHFKEKYNIELDVSLTKKQMRKQLEELL